MSIPSQTLTIRDPGLGLAADTINAYVFIGCSEKGAVNTLFAFSNIADVIDTLGQGSLSEDLCYYLSTAGAPVYGVRAAQNSAGATGSVTKVFGVTAVGTGTVTVAGSPLDAYEVTVQITASGAAGVAQFRYSLDGAHVFSPQTTVPSGGAYTIPNTGLILTFVPGAGTGLSGNLTFYAIGDTHTFACTAPLFTLTELAPAIAALLATNLDFSTLVLSGKTGTATSAATLGGALAVHGQSFFGQQRYVRFLFDAGSDTPATTSAAFMATADARLGATYGDCYVVSQKAFAGWGAPRRPITTVVAARCGNILPSTDPARNAEGPLRGVLSITHDEFRTELMDQHKFTTLRTWQGIAGFFITNGRLMSPAGSDYEFWQHGRLMDIACNTVAKAQQPLISTSIRINPGAGTIADADAQRWEIRVTNALRVSLMDPDNAEGSAGHVSALKYSVDRTTNVLLGRVVKTKVAIVPLGYAKAITTELGFATDVGG